VVVILIDKADLGQTEAASQFYPANTNAQMFPKTLEVDIKDASKNNCHTLACSVMMEA
jgi:hypothetical protein